MGVGIRGDSASHEIPLMEIIITKILCKCWLCLFGLQRLIIVSSLSTVALNHLVVLDIRNSFISSLQIIQW